MLGTLERRSGSCCLAGLSCGHPTATRWTIALTRGHRNSAPEPKKEMAHRDAPYVGRTAQQDRSRPISRTRPHSLTISDGLAGRRSSRSCIAHDDAGARYALGPATRLPSCMDGDTPAPRAPWRRRILPSRIALSWERNRHVVTRSALRTPSRCRAPAPAVASEASKGALNATDHGPPRAASRASDGRARSPSQRNAPDAQRRLR
jgi:hypothetical protein